MNFLDNFCGFLREQLNVAEKSLNSFSVWFESQEEDTFIGYLYKQGKYKELIEFLPLFFHY